MRSMTIPLAAVVLVAGLTLSALLAASQPTAAPRQTDGLEVYVVEGPTREPRRAVRAGHRHPARDAGERRRRQGPPRARHHRSPGREAPRHGLHRPGQDDRRQEGLRGRACAAARRLRPSTAPRARTAASRDELRATAAANPRIAKLVTIGRTVQGKDDPRRQGDQGRPQDARRPRPAVLYGGAQHAREWITPEMVRRLHAPLPRRLRHRRRDHQAGQHHASCGSCRWSNPDGYDFTFTEGNRLWRKNLRDNNGDGADHGGRRRRPQPQLRRQVGLRQRGLLARPGQRDLPRRRGPNSEPETKALDALFKRVGFEFYINYHSAAELLLYGIGWQVSTPTPDDVIYEAHGR